MSQVILASASSIRIELLNRIGLNFETRPARIDEHAIRDAMLAEGAKPRDVADTLAEQKALKISAKNPKHLVLGCDQILDFDNRILNKPQDREAARQQLRSLAGQEHKLLTAAVIARAGQPEWRLLTEARLTMKPLSDEFIDAYLHRNWPGISGCVGSYKLEEEGPRLFRRITGDYFTILGLPLLELCSYFESRGVLPS